MKYFYILLLLLIWHTAVAVEKSAGLIKQVTVNNYLQQARIKAIAQGHGANSLIQESSPYLLQHAYNPVDWHAWGDDAFAKAKKQNKPIFLSIGYSTCHWCHVMAHESFENKEIAAFLNKHFISIKVDREQRPDIDTVYMAATQLINGHGGWPMTVFLDHELRPFHAATYYPPFSTQTSLGLKAVLLRIHELWTQEPELINQVATSVTERITALADETNKDGALAENVNALAMRQISQNFDEDDGGFSAAPKFPRPGIFSFLNQQAKSDLKNKDKAKKMMSTTLDAMAAGGIVDQLAGGFHRYSVDERWQVPHFEKMLYSQALMVMAYSDYYQIEPQEKYKQLVFNNLDFVTNEMQSPDGGFYSALDADSERHDEPGTHAEGAYYLWHASELKQLLSSAEFDFFEKYYQIKENGNIDSDPRNEFTALNILYVAEEFQDKALTREQEKWLTAAKNKLNKQRLQRPRPHLDDKIITAWNGMMLAAFANAAMVFDHVAYLQEALRVTGFIKKHLYDNENKKLYRQYRKQGKSNRSRTQAILSDYAWLIYGLLKLHQASKDMQWLNWAYELQEKQDALFLDDTSAAYFESVANDSNLLFRSKSIYDGALPSVNAIALANLRKLSALSDNALQKKAYSTQADKLVSSFATVVNQNPAAASSLLAIENK